MHLRIALTGAQGTGKSTLARQLGEALRDGRPTAVSMIGGLGEFAAAAGIATGQRADAAGVLALARWHLAREAQLDAASGAAEVSGALAPSTRGPPSTPGTSFTPGAPDALAAAPALAIFDRCLLDTLAYAEVLGCLSATDLAELRRATWHSSRRYQQLLFLRITSDYPVTGPDDESPAFRRAIEAAIAAQAAALGIALHEVRMPPLAAADVVAAVRARLPRGARVRPPPA